MSGPQIIALYHAKRRALGMKALIDLQVSAAPNEQKQLDRVRDMLVAMAEGKPYDG
jgi:hypothetical protein